jgi:DNA-binding transcriptional ArsR family regulator
MTRSAPMNSNDLDPVWRALANPHRRRLLDLLRERPRTTGELAEALGENRFLVMQHLNLLRESNLVAVEVDGRRRINHLNPVPIQQIYERWVGKYQGDWAAALVGLKRTVETKSESRTKGRNSRG